MVQKIQKLMTQIGNDSKITVGLLLALFPIIISSWTWVSVQLATLRTDLSHYEQRISYIENEIKRLDERIDENENSILKLD